MATLVDNGQKEAIKTVLDRLETQWYDMVQKWKQEFSTSAKKNEDGGLVTYFMA